MSVGSFDAATAAAEAAVVAGDELDAAVRGADSRFDEQVQTLLEAVEIYADQIADTADEAQSTEGLLAYVPVLIGGATSTQVPVSYVAGVCGLYEG